MKVKISRAEVIALNDKLVSDNLLEYVEVDAEEIVEATDADVETTPATDAPAEEAAPAAAPTETPAEEAPATDATTPTETAPEATNA